ncbi:MAG: hypothetical protein HQL39_11665, partial [Alphaproteobacteria bacterium]|nr:hypothetical protein [Alphaproteobacteria bacterium]
MSAPVFSWVQYLSPWSPMFPAGVSTGVEVRVNTDSTQAGNVLAIRLRSGSDTLGVAVASSGTPQQLTVFPTAPLSATSSCWVEAQWVAANTDPRNVDWTNGIIATAPVVSSVATLQAATLNGLTLSMAWDFGAAALTPAGVNVNLFAGNASIGWKGLVGSSGDLTIDSRYAASATSGVSLYLQAVTPIDPSWNGAFQSPFSIGPTLAGTTLPAGAPTITGVTCDAGALRVTWTVPPQPPAAAGLVGFDLLATNRDGATTVAGLVGFDLLATNRDGATT